MQLIHQSLIQSDFRSSNHGNFEAVVVSSNEGGPMELWHYWHDNSGAALPWQRGQRIAMNVAAAGSIMQSDFKVVIMALLRSFYLSSPRTVRLWNYGTSGTIIQMSRFRGKSDSGLPLM